MGYDWNVINFQNVGVWLVQILFNVDVLVLYVFYGFYIIKQGQGMRVYNVYLEFQEVVINGDWDCQ